MTDHHRDVALVLLLVDAAREALDTTGRELDPLRKAVALWDDAAAELVAPTDDVASEP